MPFAFPGCTSPRPHSLTIAMVVFGVCSIISAHLARLLRSEVATRWRPRRKNKTKAVWNWNSRHLAASRGPLAAAMSITATCPLMSVSVVANGLRHGHRCTPSILPHDHVSEHAVQCKSILICHCNLHTCLDRLIMISIGDRFMASFVACASRHYHQPCSSLGDHLLG